jgi:hypothetical protein
MLDSVVPPRPKVCDKVVQVVTVAQYARDFGCSGRGLVCAASNQPDSNQSSTLKLVMDARSLPFLSR